MKQLGEDNVDGDDEEETDSKVAEAPKEVKKKKDIYLTETGRISGGPDRNLERAEFGGNQEEVVILNNKYEKSTDREVRALFVWANDWLLPAPTQGPVQNSTNAKNCSFCTLVRLIPPAKHPVGR